MTPHSATHQMHMLLEDIINEVEHIENMKLRQHRQAEFENQEALKFSNAEIKLIFDDKLNEEWLSIAEKTKKLVSDWNWDGSIVSLEQHILKIDDTQTCIRILDGTKKSTY